MTSRPRTERLAGYLIRRACRRLPGESRDDRYREWTAELHAILHDPGTRRGLRALAYAAGHAAGTRRLARAAGHPGWRFHADLERLTPAAITPAAITLSAVGTASGIAILIWSPANQGLAVLIFTASMTIGAAVSLGQIEWRQLRRLRAASTARSSRTRSTRVIRSTRYRPAHAGRHKRVRFFRDNWLLFAAAVELTTGSATGAALQIWSPYQGLSSGIFASSMTISLALGWQAHRRERARAQ